VSAAVADSPQIAPADSPQIERLAHVGLHVFDLQRSIDFYHGILGLQITDDDREHGLLFLSADPEDEHHQVLLCEGRSVPMDGKLIQQVSFRCRKMSDVIGFWKRLVKAGAPILYTVTHGNAVACYFRDPDDNICEVYWQTGLKARQGFIAPMDFSQPEDVLLAQVRELVAVHGETGYIHPTMLREQGLD
jgi:catechol 2,3-dioxygenase-like lactoylglutathione lyase family enzyme